MGKKKITGFTGITFIICYRKNEDLSSTISSIEKIFNVLNVDAQTSLPQYQIITVQGNHPTLQRNVAVNYAKYSHVYFLDNDSIVNFSSIQYVLSLLSDELNQSIDIIGGPSVLNQDASYFETCADGLLSCKWAVGKRNARYSQVGVRRKASSRELILCNMIIRKDFFFEQGGFNSRLYPNEENEFIVRALRQHAQVWYDPEIYVFRRQRKNYSSFIKQILGYGRGRGEEFKIWLTQKKYFKAFNFFGFLLFLVSSFVILIITSSTNIFGRSIFFIAKQVVLWYLVYLLWIWLKSSVQKKRFLLHVPIQTIFCHCFYSWGLVKACLTKRFAAQKKRKWFLLHLSK